MLLDKIINVILPFVIGLAPFFIVVFAISLMMEHKTKRRKNPINTHLLRSPGQALAEESEDIAFDLLVHLLYIPFICLVFYAYYLTSNKSTFTLSITIITILGTVSFFTYKILKFANKKSQRRLGYDAELAIGQELNQLMREGFYVFHDVNLKNTISEFNIDHIVVGKSGVFAVETKGRSKPINKDGKHDFKVSFDGKKLVFPQREETEPVEQAKRQAKALQKWLSSAVGEPIYVRTVIALPGWFIERIGNTDVAVINGKNHENYFNKVRGTQLSEKQIKQVAHQLDILCRNIEPKAFTIPK